MQMNPPLKYALICMRELQYTPEYLKHLTIEQCVERWCFFCFFYLKCCYRSHTHANALGGRTNNHSQKHICDSHVSDRAMCHAFQPSGTASKSFLARSNGDRQAKRLSCLCHNQLTPSFVHPQSPPPHLCFRFATQYAQKKKPLNFPSPLLPSHLTLSAGVHLAPTSPTTKPATHDTS